MWWINTGMPKQISLVLGPQELREWLAPWSVLAAESTLCDSWKSVSSPEQEWAKSDLFLKYLLSLKNNSSFQLMLPDCCSPPPLFFFLCLFVWVCMSVPTPPPCTSNSFSTAVILVWETMAKYVRFISGREMKKKAWHGDTCYLNLRKICAVAVVLTPVTLEDTCQPSVTYPVACANIKFFAVIIAT